MPPVNLAFFSRYADVIGGIALAAGILGGGAVYQHEQYARTPHVSHSQPPAAPERAVPFDLVEDAAKVGLSFSQPKLNLPGGLDRVAPFVQGIGGASVAVVDFDRDGWPDIYLTSIALNSGNGLYRNNQDGTFADVSEQSGIMDVNRNSGTLRALFFDYDNDGFDDLLLTTTWCPQLFHNRGDGTFEDVTRNSGLTSCQWTHASNVIDIDGDGRLDIVTGSWYGPRVDVFHPTTTVFLPMFVYGTDFGTPPVVYHNNGGGHFSLVPDRAGLAGTGFYHAIGVYDLRGTGRDDIYLGNDYHLDDVYWNSGDGHFARGSDSFQGRIYSSAGMSAEIADVDNDGHPTVFVTDTSEPGLGEQYNSMWKVLSGDSIVNVASAHSPGDLGLLRCGWSWGAKFVDFDNDGLLDLAVSNGFISASRTKTYWYEIDVLMSGSPDIPHDAMNWPPMGDSSLSGYETKCVYHNEAGAMVDVSGATGMGHDDSDGRGVASIDFLNNGVSSIVEATAGGPVKFFRNVPKQRNHWIGFSFTGTRSNRDAFGTEVALTLSNGVTQTRELQPANGFESESDARIVFGLGALEMAESVRIRWPLGAIQELKNVNADRYYALVEPQ